MSPYDREFEELHKLLDRKLGDLRYCYKIEKQGMLSAYDIFNSQKVDEYLQREGGCKSLVPGAVEEKLLAKRFGIAYRVVSQDHKLQNEDPTFCGNAQKILNEAKEILKDRQKDCAYSAWFLARLHTGADSDSEHIEVEKARREAAEEKQKRRELEERLAEAERQGRASHNTSKQPTKPTIRIPPGVLVWLGIFLAIGFWWRTIGNHDLPVPPPAPTSTPEQTPELMPTPVPLPTPGSPIGATNGTGNGDPRGTLLLRSPRPPYPQTALQMHISGDVRVVIKVENGNIVNVEASGPPMLASAASRWVKANWKFNPSANGTFTLPVSFVLH